ncbi:MAG: hypothetical protein IKZ69_04385 [Lachnospiraceae bacterium]|nr:hypothetical protein [Lachnospiraceae bacterium]
MERFYLEAPNTGRKDEAFDYIREFQEHGSRINGVGGLTHYLTDYEGWLRMTAEMVADHGTAGITEDE